MGLQSSNFNLPNALIAKVDNVVRALDPTRRAELLRLASNKRHTIEDSPREWEPFDAVLVGAGVDRNNPNDVTALVLALGVAEREAQATAVKASRARLQDAGVDVTFNRSGNFAASKDPSKNRKS
jgi:hypothetical protein